MHTNDVWKTNKQTKSVCDSLFLPKYFKGNYCILTLDSNSKNSAKGKQAFKWSWAKKNSARNGVERGLGRKINVSFLPRPLSAHFARRFSFSPCSTWELVRGLQFVNVKRAPWSVMATLQPLLVLVVFNRWLRNGQNFSYQLEKKAEIQLRSEIHRIYS